MLTALREHASRHALSYVVALLLGFSASLTAVYDNFWAIEPDAMAALGWWQVLGLICKCVAPFCATVVGYLIRSPLDSHPKESPKPA